MAKLTGLVLIALLAAGSIAGGFFYHDNVIKREALHRSTEKIESLTRKVSELDTYLARFRKKADEDERLIERLQDEVETMRQLKESLQDESAVNAAIRREIQKCEDAKASVEALFEAEKTKRLTLENRLEGLRKRILIDAEREKEQRRSLSLLEADFMALKAEKIRALEAAEQRISALTEAVSDRDADLQTARDAIREKTDRIDALGQSLQAAETRVQNAEKEIQKHLIDYKKAGVRITAQEAQIAYLLDEIRKTEDEAARRNAQLKRRIQEKEMMIGKARAQVLSLRAQVKQNMNTQAFLENKFFVLHEKRDKDRIDFDEKIARLEARITEKNKLLEETNRQLEENGLRIRVMLEENHSLQALGEAGIEAREKLAGTVSDLQRRVDAEEKMRRKVSDELSALMTRRATEKAAGEKEIAALKDRLSEWTTRAAVFQETIDALKRKRLKDATMVSALTETVSALHAQLRSEQMEAAQRNAQLKRLAREKGLQLERATAQLLKMREAIEEVIGTRTEMADQITALKSRGREDVNRLLKQLNETVQEKKHQLDAAVKEVNKWRALYEDLEGSLDLTRDQMKTLENMVEKTREEKGDMEDRIAKMGETYDALIDALRSKLETREATIKEYRKRLTLTFVDKILFGRAAVRISPRGRKVLRKTGDVLRTIPYGRIRIVGHTDSDPIRSKFRRIYPSNWELSGARAASVARFFQDELGIGPERMEIAGMAFTHPVADNNTEAGKAKNRRVEIIIVPDMKSP